MEWKYHRHQQQLSTNHITHHGFLFVSTHVIHHRITTSHHRNPCTLHKKTETTKHPFGTQLHPVLFFRSPSILFICHLCPGEMSLKKPKLHGSRTYPLKSAWARFADHLYDTRRHRAVERALRQAPKPGEREIWRLPKENLVGCPRKLGSMVSKWVITYL